MNRREFLKLSSFIPAYFYFSAGGLFNIAGLEPKITALGKMFKGTATGKIYTSVNLGKTWQLQYNLGANNAIVKFALGANHQLTLTAMNRQHTFNLALSPNGKNWLLQQKPVFSKA